MQPSWHFYFTLCLSLLYAFGRLFQTGSFYFRQLSSYVKCQWIKWFNYHVRDAHLPRYDSAIISGCDWIAVNRPPPAGARSKTQNAGCSYFLM